MTTNTHTTTQTTTTTSDDAALKARHRTTWAAGDYSAVAERLVLPIGRHAVAATSVGPGDAVLDVATGTGSAAIPAAAAGATVTGLDLVPELLEVARERARQAGVHVDWVAGDAEDLPFADESFDVVLSTLGVQFAPHHMRTAHELARVTRIGGHIGLCNWTPEGYIGRLFATLSPYMPAPPPGVSPPPLWGDPVHVERLFAGTGMEIRTARASVTFEHESPEGFIDFMATNYGPLVMARAALEQQGRWSALRGDLVGLSASMGRWFEGRFRIESEYLVVVGERRA